MLPLLPGFGASLAVGVWLLQPRKWRAAAGVSFAVYLLCEILWQLADRHWDDVWILILGVLGLSCCLGFLASRGMWRIRMGREPA